MGDPKAKNDAPVDSAAKVERALSQATRMVKAFTVLAAAIVVLLGALVSGYFYIQKLVHQADTDRAKAEQTREQAKKAAGSLATDVETLSAQVQQQHEDLAALHDYVGQQTLVPGYGDRRPKLPIRVPRPTATATTSPSATPTVEASAAPAPPAPPKLGPRPEPIEVLKVDTVFK